MLSVMLNGAELKVEKGVSILSVLKESGCELNGVCCALVNGEVSDLREEIVDDCKLEAITFDSELGKRVFWHTTAHILAQAVKKLWPDAQFGVGPAIESGFFYDVNLQHRLTFDDLEKIEHEMNQIVKQNFKIEREVVSCDEAIKFMKSINQQIYYYKRTVLYCQSAAKNLKNQRKCEKSFVRKIYHN